MKNKGQYYSLTKLLIIVLVVGLAITITIDVCYPQEQKTPLQIGMNNSEAGEWANNAGASYDESVFDKETGWTITRWNGGHYKGMQFKWFSYAITGDRVVATSICLDTLTNEQGAEEIRIGLAKTAQKVGWKLAKVENGEATLVRRGLVMLVLSKPYGPLFAPLIIIVEDGE